MVPLDLTLLLVLLLLPVAVVAGRCQVVMEVQAGQVVV